MANRLVYNTRAAVEVARSTMTYAPPKGAKQDTAARFSAGLKKDRARLALTLIGIAPSEAATAVDAVLAETPGLDLYTLVNTVAKKLRGVNNVEESTDENA